MPKQILRTEQTPVPSTAILQGFWRCHACSAVCSAPLDHDMQKSSSLVCPRCQASVTARRPHAVTHCWAYWLAAAALYIPANLLPVTQTSSLLGSQSDTILSGIVYLWSEGSWPLALLVFIASIVVPLSKLIALAYLLISVQKGSVRHLQQRTAVYRALELIGRWSMLDIYVITWLAALVQIQSLANITPGPGAMAFGAVVVLTMRATQCFDPRLMWDPLNNEPSNGASTSHD